MSKKKYLIHLSGYDGDDEYFVVGEATWNWIFSDRPACFQKGKTSYNEKIPAEVLAEATLPDEDVKPVVFVTSGSCENDRALYISQIFETRALPPHGKYTDSFEGYIY